MEKQREVQGFVRLEYGHDDLLVSIAPGIRTVVAFGEYNYEPGTRI